MDRSRLAGDYFLQGYSCSQAVLLAFGDLTGLSESVALRLASSFGGGISGMRQTCGCISAAAMVLGMVQGFEQPDLNAKKEHYRRVRAAFEPFLERHGTVVCSELLKSVSAEFHNDPMPRTPEYYQKRPCLRLVEETASLLQSYLES